MLSHLFLDILGLNPNYEHSFIVPLLGIPFVYVCIRVIVDQVIYCIEVYDPINDSFPARLVASLIPIFTLFLLVGIVWVSYDTYCWVVK